MTEQEILSGNKLIAEFMGYEGQHEDWCGNNIEVDDPFSDTGKSMAPYNVHEKWSWLMPVVEKIAKTESSHIGLGYQQGKVLTLPITTPIEVLYLSIITFITWYNSKNHD